MTEYQITSWRDLPSMVTAREGDDVAKVQLGGRFQLAIDEAAMRLGDVNSGDYLEGWARSPWTTADGTSGEVVAAMAEQIEKEWSQERLDEYLDSLG